MAMRYSRSALLSMRNWWKKQPRNIKPMLPTDWNTCKAAGILKHTRRKRGGSFNRMTNSIQVLTREEDKSLFLLRNLQEIKFRQTTGTY